MVWLEALTAIVLMGLSAFFSGSETAFFAITKDQVALLKDEKRKNADLLERLLEKHSDLLIAILLGNTLVNVGASVLVTAVMFGLCDSAGIDPAYGVLATIVVMPVILLVFGEVTPKSFALRNASSYALAAAGPIYIFMKLFNPFVVLLRKLSIYSMSILGRGRPVHFLTEDDVKTLFRLSGEEGMFEKDEKEMINSIFEFGDTVVREVMVPRTDICALEIGMDIEEITTIIREHGHSRIPVYKDSIDNVLGILYAKDLLKYLTKDENNLTDFDLEKAMRKAYFVPESKNIDDLLREFQKDKNHLAIVVDEYGGTAGLVTMEDILEEIVGEIFDEYDVEEKLYEIVNEKVVIADGKMDIGEFNDIFHVELQAEDSETLGGFFLDQFGEVPVKGQSIEYEGIKFIVEKVVKNRIVSLKIILNKNNSENPDEVRK